MHYSLNQSQAIQCYHCEPEIVVYIPQTKDTVLLPVPISNVYAWFLQHVDNKISLEDLKNCCELIACAENSEELISSALSTLNQLTLIEPAECK